MIRHIGADYILPVSSPPVKDGIISVNDRGEILRIHSNGKGPDTDLIERHEGIIVPGFINSHCHLELSHMLGVSTPGKGLVSFLTEVITKRSSSNELILEAMRKADADMRRNGIVAVADISNNIVSKEVKLLSDIYYHTFVEFLGFDPQKAEAIYEHSLKLLHAFDSLPASLAPHATYSVSKELLKIFKKNKSGRNELTTIHNQESDDENELYRYKTGKFIDFYKHLNIDIDFFKPQARNSIQSVIPLFPVGQRILLVHNTYTGLKDTYFANRFNRDIWWCFCPKANLYIENRLPKIEMFRHHDFNITVGTDSLASNDKLCILSELQAIKQSFPSLSFTETLRWATLNGARFLGVENKYGSLEPGKAPGLNLITNTDGVEITQTSKVRKLI